MLSDIRAPYAVLFLVAGACAVTIARAMTLSFLAIKLQRDFDLGPAMIGFLLGAGSLLGAFVAPVVGALSDGLGRKKILALVLLTLATGMIALALAETVIVFCAAQVTTATAISLYGPMSRALMSDICTETVRLKYISWRYTASNVGWAVGPVIGLAAGVASTTLFLTASAIYLMLALVLQLIHFPAPNSADEQLPAAGLAFLSNIRTAVRDRRLQSFIAGSTFLIAVYGQWTVTLAPYLTNSLSDGVEIYAYAVSTNGFVVLVGNPLARRIVERFGAYKAVAVGCVFFVISQIGLMISVGLSGVLVSMILFTVGEILVIPSEYVLIDNASTERNRGSYFGAQSFSMIGSFIGPAIGGAVLETFGGVAMFSVFAGFAVIGLMFFAVSMRMSPPSS